MIIKKKCWPEWFRKILSGDKNFDYRLADFDISPGDTLVLEEWNPETKEYTGRAVSKTVKYVSRTKSQAWWNPEEVSEKGFVIMGFE